MYREGLVIIGHHLQLLPLTRALASVTVSPDHSSFWVELDGPNSGKDLLCIEILGSMGNMVVRKRSNGVVAVIMTRVLPQVDSVGLANRFGGFNEILGQELALLAKVVVQTLGASQLHIPFLYT